MSGSPSEPFRLYADLSMPVVAVDADHRIVFINPRGEAFWGVSLDVVAGKPAHTALHITPPAALDPEQWGRHIALKAITKGDPLSCRTTDADGHTREVFLSGTHVAHCGQWYAVLIVSDRSALGPIDPVSDSALRDPLTGLHNLHQWQAEFPERHGKAGTAVFFQLGGLNELNHLAGHRAGDTCLMLTARALAAHAPDGSLVVRFGDAEFIMVLDEQHRDAAAAIADRVVATALAAADGEVPFPLDLSYGAAPFEPGGLLAAVDRADQALYQRQGVLLRGTNTGRIVLTRGGRSRVMGPEEAESGARQGPYAHKFGSEFDAHFRRMFARSVEQAREFVEFVAPLPGAAVVEVGAGSGRITFDGGLAARIGRDGQLLVTDPSGPQLKVARGRARELGLDWLRFLQAPVEDLPLASDAADLVLGSTFLHFTDAPAAIKAMARIVRPGGRVAISAGLKTSWGPAWIEALEPIRVALEVQGLPLRDIFMPKPELEALFAESGLVIDRASLSGQERVEFPAVELVIAIARQTRIVSLLLRGLDEARYPALESAFESGMQRAFHRLGPGSASIALPSICIVAHRPE